MNNDWSQYAGRFSLPLRKYQYIFSYHLIMGLQAELRYVLVLNYYSVQLGYVIVLLKYLAENCLITTSLGNEFRTTLVTLLWHIFSSLLLY